MDTFVYGFFFALVILVDPQDIDWKADPLLTTLGDIQKLAYPILASLFAIPGSAVMIGLTGGSFGKWLFGVRILDPAGQTIGIERALRREVSVWARGLGLGIPIIAPITVLAEFRRLSSIGAASWDRKLGIMVVHRSHPLLQGFLTGIGIVGIIALFVGLIALPVSSFGAIMGCMGIAVPIFGMYAANASDAATTSRDLSLLRRLRFQQARAWASGIAIIGTIALLLHWRGSIAEGQVTTPAEAVTVWAGFVFAFVVSVLASFWFWWSYANAQAAATVSTARTELIRGYCVLGAAFLFFGGAAALGEIKEIYRTAVLRQSYPKFTGTVDVASRTINVRGFIGRGISGRIGEALNSHREIDAVSITSPGGFIDEALDVASIIARKNIAVIAHEQCDSACIIVLLSGVQRFADWDLNLGFHASQRILITSDEVSERSVSQRSERSVSQREVDRYLVTRGVPKEIVNQANSIGPNKMNSVPAIKLAEAGALTGLLDDGKIISINVAKWLKVERAVARRSAGDALAKLLSSIRLSSPNTVDREAGRIYTALEAKDAAVLRNVISDLVSTISAAAIEAADPEATFAYLEALLRHLRKLSLSESWSTCARHADRLGVPLLIDASTGDENEELLALSELIRSAGASGWTRRPIQSWAEAQGLQIGAKNWTVSPGGKLDPKSLEPNLRAKCLWITELANEVVQLGVERGVPTFRWIIAQDRSRDVR